MNEPPGQPEGGWEAFHQAVALTARQIAAVVEQDHGPKWKAQNDVAKTLLTLSSGALVLTLTFADQLLAGQGLLWRQVLFVSWFALIVCTVTAVGSLWLSIDVRSVGIRLQNTSPELWAAFSEAVAAGESSPLEAVRQKIEEAAWPIHKSDRRSWLLLRTALFSFVLALGLLAAVAWSVLVYPQGACPSA